ncbi:MAG: hypothetical protein RSD82_07320 [Comamonas sp.]|jgi:hypothetical protein
MWTKAPACCVIANTHVPASIATALIEQVQASGDVVDAIAQAKQCLERFTSAFNQHDLAGMDANLHFPHQMWAGADLLVWQHPGSHPVGFFDQLCSTGWAHTRYESIQPVLASAHKVHLLVDYSRRSAQDETLSRHQNLWVVVQRGGRWGIVLRSY